MRSGIVTLDYLYEFKEEDYPNLKRDYQYGIDRFMNILELYSKTGTQITSFDQINDYHKNELIFDLRNQFRNRFQHLPKLTDDSGLYKLTGSLIEPIIKGDLSNKEYNLILHFRTEKLLWLETIADKLVLATNIQLKEKEFFKMMSITLHKNLWISSYIETEVNGRITELSAAHHNFLIDSKIVPV